MTSQFGAVEFNLIFNCKEWNDEILIFITIKDEINYKIDGKVLTRLKHVKFLQETASITPVLTKVTTVESKPLILIVTG